MKNFNSRIMQKTRVLISKMDHVSNPCERRLNINLSDNQDDPNKSTSGNLQEK